MFITLPGGVHFQGVLDQLPQSRTARPNLFEQGPRFGLRKSLGVLLNAIGNFDRHPAIDRRFQFLVIHVLHPHLGVLLRIEVVVDAHPLVQTRDEDLVEGHRQQIVLGL